MGCFEDFIELREATERLKKEGCWEPQATAKGGCSQESGRTGPLGRDARMKSRFPNSAPPVSQK